MNRSEQDRMLGEILAGNELAGFRQASLERALASLRRRRRQRALRTGVLGLTPFLVVLGFLLSRLHETHLPKGTSPGAPPVLAAAASIAAPPVKFITDDELMALFPGRAVALIGKPGHQQFIFLDELPPETNDDSEPSEQ